MRRPIGWLLIASGTVPMIAIAVAWILEVIGPGADQDPGQWANLGYLALGLVWAIPAAILVLAGAWLVRTSRP